MTKRREEWLEAKRRGLQQRQRDEEWLQSQWRGLQQRQLDRELARKQLAAKTLAERGELPKASPLYERQARQ